MPVAPTSLPSSPSSPVLRSSRPASSSFARPAGRIGDLALLQVLSGSRRSRGRLKGGPPLVLSLGTLAAGFAFPLLLHLVLAYPTGRLGSRATRGLVLAVYLEAAPLRDWPGAVPRSFFDPTAGRTAPTTSPRALAPENRPRDPRCRPLVRRGRRVCASGSLHLAAGHRERPARRTLWPVLSSGIALRRGDARVLRRPLPIPAREPE